MPKNNLEMTCGTLSRPSKMPGFGTSIPTKYCKTGSRLAQIEGTVCSQCYAMRGNYLYEVVQNALEYRYKQLKDPNWVDHMTKLIESKVNPRDPYFRIHDSGDWQGVWHIRNWTLVADNLQCVRFWAPTKETQMLSVYLKKFGPLPSNFVVRLSAYRLGERPSNAQMRLGPTSTVGASFGYKCPAPNQGNKCGNCRACWDSTVNNVDYKKK